MEPPGLPGSPSPRKPPLPPPDPLTSMPMPGTGAIVRFWTLRVVVPGNRLELFTPPDWFPTHSVVPGAELMHASGPAFAVGAKRTTSAVESATAVSPLSNNVAAILDTVLAQ